MKSPDKRSVFKSFKECLSLNEKQQKLDIQESVLNLLLAIEQNLNTCLLNFSSLAIVILIT